MRAASVSPGLACDACRQPAVRTAVPGSRSGVLGMRMGISRVATRRETENRIRGGIYGGDAARLRREKVVCARIGDPDASVDEESDPDMRPPTLWHKVFGSLFYLIPWIDVTTLGLNVYNTFRGSWSLYFLMAPLIPVYYASPFIPLVVFFVVFLAVVRNKKIPHLIRFNACQAIMIDICAMMFNLLRMYFPAEVRWSVLLDYFDRFSYVASMAAIIYCIFWTLRGYYADIPFVSEASYIQVELAEHS